MGKRIYSDEQIDEMCALREQGKSYGQIRQRFAAQGIDVSEGAISWHCLVKGADLPADRRQESTVKPGAIELRGNHVVRRFTEGEDRKILRMEGEGARIADIAKHLGRKSNSIRGRLATLARREERAQ